MESPVPVARYNRTSALICGCYLQLLLLCCSSSCCCNALQVVRSWQAAPPSQSILALAHLTLQPHKTKTTTTTTTTITITDGSSEQFLAVTAGHSIGPANIDFWRWPSTVDTINTVDVSAPHKVRSIEAAHSGSIFSFSALGDYLLSGSFDRSATLHRFAASKGAGTTDSGVYSSSRIGTLPEHTGWVRQVLIVSQQQQQQQQHNTNNNNKLFLLSIGCNLINIWTTNNQSSTKRIARLDAGPSPQDPTNEPFRRHDILCITTTSNKNTIVAGLVDGTLRAFATHWDTWKERELVDGNGDDESQPQPLCDATGSCADRGLPDEIPFAAVTAHEGRVTAVHAIPSYSKEEEEENEEFVSVGYDAHWRRWSVDRTNGRFVLLGQGNLPDETDEPQESTSSMSTSIQAAADTMKQRRIKCSVVLSEPSKPPALVVGTFGGRIYRIPLQFRPPSTPTTTTTNDDKQHTPLPIVTNMPCVEIWSEASRDISITALATLSCHPPTTTTTDTTTTTTTTTGATAVLVAGTSDGVVHAFT